MLTTTCIFRRNALSLCRYYASTSTPPVLEATEVVKRGRGRPRKYPIDPSNPPAPQSPRLTTSATTSDVSQPRRGRGRPRKDEVNVSRTQRSQAASAPLASPELEHEQPAILLPRIRKLPASEMDHESGSVELPPHLLWREHFSTNAPSTRSRISVSNPETAKLLAEQFVPEGVRDKVIIEAFPGPGALTRALLALPRERIKKIIIMEEHKPYLAYLRPLAEMDDRVHIIERSAWSWDAYTELESGSLLDGVDVIPWNEGVHPQLQFISHLPLDILGEQFASQLLRSIPDQQWLFRYGRVPMQLILSDWVWQRMAPTKPSHVCKLSVVARATASCNLLIPHHFLTPYNAHFHPVALADFASAGLDADSAAEVMRNRRAGYPFQVIGVVPRGETEKDGGKDGGRLVGRGMMDKWDYVLRRLFVLKASPLKKVMPSLAPGASTLLRKLSDPELPKSQRVDIDLPVRELQPRDWALIVKAFHEWPFAPEDLMITDNLSRDRHSRHAERK